MSTTNSETVRDRLLKFLGYKHLTQKHFERVIGASNCYVKNIGNSIGADKQNAIRENFPELNLGWVLTGDGEMLNSGENFSITMSGNNTTGNISQGNNNDSSSSNELLKQIIELKDKIAALKRKVFKASVCPSMEDMQKSLNEILFEEE